MVDQPADLDTYVDLFTQIEEITSLYVHWMRAEGLSGPQALIVLRLGSRTLTVSNMPGDVYQGRNISYNLKYLVERRFVTRTPDPHDGRVIHVALTREGHRLRELLLARHSRFCRLQADHVRYVSDTLKVLRSLLDT